MMKMVTLFANNKNDYIYYIYYEGVMSQDWKKEFVFWITLKPKINKYSNSVIFFRNNKPHNVGFPASIYLYTNGKVRSMTYYYDGQKQNYGQAKHKIDAIVAVEYYESGVIERVEYSEDFNKEYPTLDECFDPNNTRHALVITYHESGKVKNKTYNTYQDSKMVLPRYVGFYEKGQLYFVTYNSNPESWKYSHIKYYKSGAVKQLSRSVDEKFYCGNKKFYKDGNILSKTYHINNNMSRVVLYYPNGIIKQKENYKPNSYKIIKYYNSGTKKSIKYYSYIDAYYPTLVRVVKCDENIVEDCEINLFKL